MATFDYSNSLNFNDASVQHTLAVRLGKAFRDDTNKNPLMYMRERSDSWQDNVDNVIQSITLKNREGGIFTKKYHQSNATKIRKGDQPLDFEATRHIGHYDFNFSPAEYHGIEGYEIPSTFSEAVVSVPQAAKIEHQLKGAMQSFFNELFIIKASGRVGDSSKMAYEVWTDGETGYDVSGVNTARETSPNFNEINDSTDVVRTPTEVWTPNTTDFSITPVTHPSTLTAANGSVSFEFLNRVKTRVTELVNHRERGVPFNAPMMNNFSENKGTEGKYGSGTRIPVKDKDSCCGAVLFDPQVMLKLRDDQKWIDMQQSLATKIGEKSGQITGIVGDINGLRIYEMLKLIKYRGGATGNVTVSRGLLMGQNGMMEVLCNYDMPDMRYKGYVKNYQKKIMDTPTNVQVRVGDLNTGRKKSIFYSAYYNPVAVQYATNFTSPNGHNYPFTGNIIALDTVA